MTTNTIRLHRVLRATPDQLYRAFVVPDAFVRWLPPFGFTARLHVMEPVVGGAWRMSFTNFATGHSHSFGGKYLELVPGQRIAYDVTFDDPDLPGTMTTTVTLTPVSCGTEMSVVQEGIPGVIPTELCYLGWQESLVALAQLAQMAEPEGSGRGER